MVTLLRGSLLWLHHSLFLPTTLAAGLLRSFKMPRPIVHSGLRCWKLPACALAEATLRLIPRDTAHFFCSVLRANTIAVTTFPGCWAIRKTPRRYFLR